ncbi:hypothetical protein SAMN05444365_102246 [Micromonospora pattaloongensis]|uniref:Uncharacterized protein n=1 Tax=Micromonospora pattaloongensis TaxID=405436 RepID=A0A1H3JTP3_9ACTN|nr:hypothetical protein SAMN05444365_102246 [Micromonospora pattaloongensis]
MTNPTKDLRRLFGRGTIRAFHAAAADQNTAVS